MSVCEAKGAFLFLVLFGIWSSQLASGREELVLAREGKALMKILKGNSGAEPKSKTSRHYTPPNPVSELRHYLDKISGAKFQVEAARSGAEGIYVGK